MFAAYGDSCDPCCSMHKGKQACLFKNGLIIEYPMEQITHCRGEWWRCLGCQGPWTATMASHGCGLCMRLLPSMRLLSL